MKSRGFSIIELVISMLVTTLVILGSVGAISYFNSKIMIEFSVSDLKGDAEMTLRILEKEISNVSRINPPEDFQSNDDALYSGYATFPSGVFSGCAGGDGQATSIFRYTRFDTKFPPARVLDRWIESVDGMTETLKIYPTVAADETEAEALLRYKTLFEKRELLIVDADGSMARRFKVVGSPEIKPRPVDEDAWAPVVQNYLELTLAMPNLVNGSPQNPRDVSFVTDSLAFAVATDVVCASPEGDLLRVSADGTSTVLLYATPLKYKVGKLDVKFADALQGRRLEPPDLLTFPSLTTATKPCINSVSLDIVFEPIFDDDKNRKAANWDRLVGMHNFTNARTVGCAGP